MAGTQGFRPPGIADPAPKRLDSHREGAYPRSRGSATLPMTDWLHANDDIWKRTVIPGHLKWEVRDKLDHSNITE